MIEERWKSKLVKIGALLSIFASIVLGVYLIIVGISEFAGIYPSWYDYQSWYPHYPGGYKGVRAGKALGVLTMALTIIIASTIQAFRKRDLPYTSLALASTTILILFGTFVAPASAALQWGVVTAVLAFFGGTLLALAHGRFKKSPLFDRVHPLIVALVLTIIASLLWAFIGLRGFEWLFGSQAPLIWRLIVGGMMLLPSGLGLSSAFYIWKRTSIAWVLPALTVMLLYHFIFSLRFVGGEFYLFAIPWIFVVFATVLVAGSQEDFE